MTRFVQQLCALAVLVSVSPLSALAQPNVVSVRGVQSRLTANSHVAHGAALAYSRDLNRWLSVGTTAHAVRTEGRDPIDLILIDRGRWRDRTQAVLDVHADLTPLRLRTGPVGHRAGVVAGAAGRWKDETHLHGGVVGTFPEDATPAQRAALDDLMRIWDARGPDYEVITFHHDGSGAERRPGTPPSLLDPGTAAAYVRHHEALDVGLSLGLVYGASLGRTAVDARVVYRRYRDQRRVVGSHALDLSVGVGHRF